MLANPDNVDLGDFNSIRLFSDWLKENNIHKVTKNKTSQSKFSLRLGYMFKPKPVYYVE